MEKEPYPYRWADLPRIYRYCGVSGRPDGQTDRQTQTDTQTHGQTDRHTDRQTDARADRHYESPTHQAHHGPSIGS